jgi:hypothetical protein
MRSREERVEPGFAERWPGIQASWAQIEADYQRQRLRPSGWEPPQGEELEKLVATLEEVCRLYLETADANRRTIRDFFKSSYVVPRYLLGLAHSLADQIETGGGEGACLIALAAISIENNRTDYRDTFVILGRLYHRALRAGLDPRRLFDRAARLSSDQIDFDYNRSSMREFLSRFEQSAFFQADVAPYLGAEQLPLEKDMSLRQRQRSP